MCHTIILLCGDIEVNPGPTGKKVCPQCTQFVTNRQKKCKRGYYLVKKHVSSGRPVRTTCAAGYKVSTGRQMGTAVSNGYNATTGCPVGTTQDAGFNASQGCPMGTTCDKGFAVSTGRPLGITYNNSSKSSLIEDDPGKLNEHIKQYDLPLTWNTDINCLSLNKDMIIRGRKMIS